MNKLIRITKLYIFFIITLISILLIRCDKNQSNIPYVYVDFYVSIDDPEYLDLSTVGNHVFLKNAGVTGVIIYRSSINEFHAYDRTCTYKPDKNCAVIDDTTSSILVECPCCGSNFSLDYGYVTTGPATRPLKEYHTSFDGVTLHVYN